MSSSEPVNNPTLTPNTLPPLDPTLTPGGLPDAAVPSPARDPTPTVRYPARDLTPAVPCPARNPTPSFPSSEPHPVRCSTRTRTVPIRWGYDETHGAGYEAISTFCAFVADANHAQAYSTFVALPKLMITEILWSIRPPPAWTLTYPDMLKHSRDLTVKDSMKGCDKRLKNSNPRTLGHQFFTPRCNSAVAKLFLLHGSSVANDFQMGPSEN